ncbi:MAG: hypothetical protein PHV06_10175 [bacterium]|nr:hypothetical protein [bacterium]
MTRPFQIDPELPKENWRHEVFEYNDMILQIGIEKQVKVIDVYNLIRDWKYFIDEAHFNTEGNFILSVELKKEILEE